MPAISVVIPVYNAAPFLREALDSLLAQTCGDFEAIAVNDGSTDNSLEILQEYAARDSRIRILDGPNGGYGKAMNRGMDAATGKYMAILEPDDYLPREAYAVLLPLAEMHQLDVVRGCHCQFYENNGSRIYSYHPPIAPEGVLICPRKEQDKLLTSAATTWNSLYCLDFLRQNNIRYHESPGASYQDTGMYILSAVYADRYMLIREPVYMYRVDNPSSSVNTADNKSHAMMREYDYIRECIMRNPDIWRTVQVAYWGCAVSSWEWMLGLLSEPKRISYMETLSERVRPLVEQGALPAPHAAKWSALLQLPTLCERCESLLKLPAPRITREVKLCGLPLFSVSMSQEYTVWKLLGVPLLCRCRCPRWQNLTSGIRVANAMQDVYYFLGIPVHCKWAVRSGEPLPMACVSAMVEN